MTFRARVIAATVGVAAVAVIFACVASYLTTRSAVLNSVDVSLTEAAQATRYHFGNEATTGSFFELVLADGQTVPNSNIPIDQTIRSIASGKAGQALRTVQIGDQWFRELIVPLDANSVISCATGTCAVKSTAAELFVVNITGQIGELKNLLRVLLIIAAGGLIVALGLGLLIARTAMRPLEVVAIEIEGVAESNDLTYRIAEGGADELGRLRRVFNRLLNSVQSSQTLQRQLVLDASHELRTPLTSLRTNAQVLSRADELSADDLHQLTQDMVAQVDELAALVTGLGELARGDRSEGAQDPLRLDECVDECVETARTHARIRDISIDTEIETSTVRGRRDRVERAITNLLTNAVKFTPDGGRVRVTTAHGAVVVSDSGPGVEEVDRAFVFDRFWRSASARSLPGSGLGLSIVAQVVAELQGSVTVDRDPELGGARFTMTLPEVVEA